MPKQYQIEIFGKKGCQKCTSLKKRVQRILDKETQFRDFAMAYHDLTTVDGLYACARAETVSGQRIPAVQVTRYNPRRKKYEKISDPRPETRRNGKLCVPVYLQLETDYSSAKNAVIKPVEVKELMSMAVGAS